VGRGSGHRYIVVRMAFKGNRGCIERSKKNTKDLTCPWPSLTSTITHEPLISAPLRKLMSFSSSSKDVLNTDMPSLNPTSLDHSSDYLTGQTFSETSTCHVSLFVSLSISTSTVRPAATYATSGTPFLLFDNNKHNLSIIETAPNSAVVH